MAVPPGTRMQLHQMNLGYDVQHDRLLLRVATTDSLEYRLWLTRRMVKGLWPGLVQLMQNTPMARQQAEPGAKQAVVEFQREQALAQTQFGGAYDGERMQPAVPGEPMLVWAVRMRPNPDGGNDLEFLPKDGPGLHMRLQDAMIHAFAKLLQDTMRTTDWDFVLSLPSAAPTQPAPVSGERKLN